MEIVFCMRGLSQYCQHLTGRLIGGPSRAKSYFCDAVYVARISWYRLRYYRSSSDKILDRHLAMIPGGFGHHIDQAVSII